MWASDAVSGNWAKGNLLESSWLHSASISKFSARVTVIEFSSQW